MKMVIQYHNLLVMFAVLVAIVTVVQRHLHLANRVLSILIQVPQTLRHVNLAHQVNTAPVKEIVVVLLKLVIVKPVSIVLVDQILLVKSLFQLAITP